jgi:hypothetical protein
MRIREALAYRLERREAWHEEFLAAILAHYDITGLWDHVVRRDEVVAVVRKHIDRHGGSPLATRIRHVLEAEGATPFTHWGRRLVYGIKRRAHTHKEACAYAMRLRARGPVPP